MAKYGLGGTRRLIGVLGHLPQFVARALLDLGRALPPRAAGLALLISPPQSGSVAAVCMHQSWRVDGKITACPLSVRNSDRHFVHRIVPDGIPYSN